MGAGTTGKGQRVAARTMWTTAARRIAGLRPDLHALPLAFEDRLSEPCDRPDVMLRLCLQRFLNAQPRDCGFNRLVETLMICVDRIDEQLDLRLGKDDSLEFLEHRRIRIERAAAVIPLVLPH